jgi:hypothetical protein
MLPVTPGEQMSAMSETCLPPLSTFIELQALTGEV